MNKNIDKREHSKSGQGAEARELWGANPAALSCPKCDASKVATSRPQLGDQLRALLWPALPYRCLRCYHRFWHRENFFANKARVLFWGAVVLSLSFVLFKSLNPLLSGDLQKHSAAFKKPFEALLNRDDEANDSMTATGQQPSVTGSRGRADTTNNDSSLSTIDLANLSSQPVLTLEQQKHQVKLAKQQAEMAAQQSQARIAQMETSLAPDPLERESLAKVEVGYAIEQWRAAWATGDVQTYLRQYSRDFTPDEGLSVTEWESQRRSRVVPGKQVSLSLSGFDMSFSDQLTKAYVEFEQSYAAGEYSEASKKQLVLSKSAAGWKIVSETELKQ